jgi:nitrogen fixation/metabolism regulation signal transduction histidine kinase
MEEDGKELLTRLIESFNSMTDQLRRLNENVEKYNNMFSDDNIDLSEIDFGGKMDS